jgi:hypothetical protein
MQNLAPDDFEPEARMKPIAAEEGNSGLPICAVLASLTVETNVDLVVDLHECVVAGGRGPRVDDPCAADRVRAAGLVDVATEDEVGLLALDERPHDGAADVLPARESVAGGSPRRGVRAEDREPRPLRCLLMK